MTTPMTTPLLILLGFALGALAVLGWWLVEARYALRMLDDPGIPLPTGDIRDRTHMLLPGGRRVEVGPLFWVRTLDSAETRKW